MNTFFKKLIIVIIGATIFLGIPYIFGWGFIFLSWLAALIIMMYLEEE